ncbi:MAG: NfeD family protein [Candidatus Thermoplasmatota archaeon]
MKKSIKFLLFILDELRIITLLIIILLHYNLTQLSITMIILLIAITIFLAYISLPHLKKPTTGTEAMEGQHATTIETLNPTGKIKIKGEIWNAESIDGKIKKKNKTVKIEKVDNLTLIVKKSDKQKNVEE